MARFPRKYWLLSLGPPVVIAAIAACDGPPPNMPTKAAELQGQARVAALARTCARVASCAHPDDPPHFRDPSACVEHALESAGALDPVAQCLEAADSCDAVAVCLHRKGDPHAAAYCAAHPATKTDCEGDVLVTCAKDDPRESTLTPCAPLGAACGESRSAGGLVAHGCLSRSECPPDVTRVRCDGETSIVACHDEIRERVTCRPGTTCHAHKDEDGEEAATCEGPNELGCSAVGQRACHGAVLVDCVAHGHHAREESVDCTKLGLTCGAASGKAACVTEGSSCVAGPAKCDASGLSFCAAGETVHVACGDIGLGPCNPQGSDLCAPVAAPSPAGPAR